MFVQKIMPRKLRGFTLTEAAIVLGIVGLILGAIWVAAASVYANMRIQTTSTQLIQTVQAIRAIHATQHTITASTTDLISAGVIPSDMVNNAGTAALNVWGGAVTVTPAASGLQFTIQYVNVPSQACMELLPRLTGPGRDTGLTSAAGIIAFPITVTQAVGACDDASGSETMDFIFRLRG